MYEIFEKLCDARGITPYRFCKECDVSSSTISTWKKAGSLARPELAKKVCDYFEVSLDYLMTGKEADLEEGYYANPETAQIAQEIFENKELRLLFDASRNAKPEDLKLAHDMLLALKRKERGDID